MRKIPGQGPFIIAFISGRSVVLGGVQGQYPQIFCVPPHFFDKEKKIIFQKFNKTNSFTLKMYFESLQLSNLAFRLD